MLAPGRLGQGQGLQLSTYNGRTTATATSTGMSSGMSSGMDVGVGVNVGNLGVVSLGGDGGIWDHSNYAMDSRQRMWEKRVRTLVDRR